MADGVEETASSLEAAFLAPLQEAKLQRRKILAVTTFIILIILNIYLS
jgi:hypothetical protein